MTNYHMIIHLELSGRIQSHDQTQYIFNLEIQYCKSNSLLKGLDGEFVDLGDEVHLSQFAGFHKVEPFGRCRRLGGTAEGDGSKWSRNGDTVTNEIL